MAQHEIDSERLKDYTRLLFGHLSGAMTSALLYLGDHLDLFAVLAESGPVTSAELAEKTGLSERWLREWLYGLGAAEILEHHGNDRFALSAEGAVVLSDENHPAHGAGFFSQLPQLMRVAEQLPEAFRTGLGLPYDALGAEGAVGVERGLAPFFRTLLVPLALPRVKDVVARLESGIRVADVGCGGGVAVIEMARAYPNSEFHGYDISKHALTRAEQNRAEAGLDNVSFHDAAADPLPQDASFPFITTFDCLHDMAHPGPVMRQIRGAIADDGLWLIADIKARATYEENVEKNPMAAMMYGTSVLSCMSSALSEPDGLGLGTLGFHEDLARKMTEEAGFTRFEPLDLKHPVNAFYVVQP